MTIIERIKNWYYKLRMHEPTFHPPGFMCKNCECELKRNNKQQWVVAGNPLCSRVAGKYRPVNGK